MVAGCYGDLAANKGVFSKVPTLHLASMAVCAAETSVKGSEPKVGASPASGTHLLVRIR